MTNDRTSWSAIRFVVAAIIALTFASSCSKGTSRDSTFGNFEAVALGFADTNRPLKSRWVIIGTTNSDVVTQVWSAVGYHKYQPDMEETWKRDPLHTPFRYTLDFFEDARDVGSVESSLAHVMIEDDGYAWWLFAHAEHGSNFCVVYSPQLLDFLDEEAASSYPATSEWSITSSLSMEYGIF